MKYNIIVINYNDQIVFKILFTDSETNYENK